MGVLFSCPFSDTNDRENAVEAVFVRSISLGNNELKTLARSISFNARNSETAILKSLGSGKMTVEGSISLKRGESEGVVSVEPNDAKHHAALKLQKVYKSFRTRRKLADCAVLVEQSWWRLLDFAELKHSSVSFFDFEKHETAISRWSRARTRAAKVGKGLLKNDKARKLALQHWLEAIDPRHRYGHNLHFYYETWLKCQSREPFFYWLDVGEGKEMNLVENCPRQKLHQQCIKYLGPVERKTYEVEVTHGRLSYKQSGELLDTSKVSKETKWIFVLSTSRVLYVGKKKKGKFQHSSFLAGGATSAAGRLIAQHGILKAIWPHSGHYRPTKENFQDFISFLKENRVNLDNVKMIPVDEEDSTLRSMKSSLHLRSNFSHENMTKECNGTETSEITVPENSLHDSDSSSLHSTADFGKPAKENLSEDNGMSNENVKLEDGHEHNSIAMLHLKPYRSSKKCGVWTSGAGPRITCVRDYPSEMQTRVLEEVNLSPRSAGFSGFVSSPRSPSRLCVMAQPKHEEGSLLSRRSMAALSS